MKELITALCGSYLWGLNTENSDRDYITIVTGNGVENLPDGCFAQEKRDGADYFLLRLDALYDISACASPMMVPSYGAVVASEAPLLYEFWKCYTTQLADICPSATYQIALDQVESHLEAGQERSYAACARLLGLICGRYETGDMLSARQLSEAWRERYYAAKAGEVTSKDVAAWLQSCKTASYRDYYETQQTNRKLHNQYQYIIDETISMFGSDAEKQKLKHLGVYKSYSTKGGNPMIEHILPAIKDPADYITALSVFKSDGPLTAGDADKLLAVYAKYQTYVDAAEDPDYLKLCVAVDLLPGRTEENAADFAALELGSTTLGAIFAAENLVARRDDLTAEAASCIVEQVQDETVLLPARVLLARVALDVMTGARNFVELQEQVRVLAAFLTSMGTETLDLYTNLVMEVRLKCRK